VWRVVGQGGDVAVIGGGQGGGWGGAGGGGGGGAKFCLPCRHFSSGLYKV